MKITNIHNIDHIKCIIMTVFTNDIYVYELQSIKSKMASYSLKICEFLSCNTI
jgi:hypothetical protein